MHIPNEVKLFQVAKSDDSDNGCWFQHHRNDDLLVGVVSRCAKRGTPTLQTWYCDYLLDVTFLTLQDLQRAALTITQAARDKVVAEFPRVVNVEPLAPPSKGHVAPRCALFTTDVAKYSCTLMRSWFPDYNRMLLVGDRAMAKIKKKDVAWAALIIKQQEAARMAQ